MPGTITPRQREILKMRATGKTMKAVAIELGLHENTIKNASCQAFERLDVPGLVEAMHVLGWVRLED